MNRFRKYRRLALAAAATFSLASTTAMAQNDLTFPKSFGTQEVAANGTTLHVRVGGAGPAVVLLHGYGDTGDMWVPLARELARDHRVIVPDLRGMGLSARADGGFEKANEAADVIGVMDALGVNQADVVAHDIGNMVAYAFAARHADRVRKLVLMDAPVPGIGPWEEVLQSPLLWHFRFGGPDMERLVAGRERIYLDRFWNAFAARPARFTEAARAHYAALYAAPGRMHAGFGQFAAFDRDAVDNRAWLAAHGKLTMPVLAIGGDRSFGPMMAVVARGGAINVEERVIADAGHWLMEEQPAATTQAIRDFLGATGKSANGRLAPTALSLEETQAAATSGAGVGTSGVDGIRTVLLSGDPAQRGPYVLEIRVPANTSIAPHIHRDDRTATVVSGTWYFGYGSDRARAREGADRRRTLYRAGQRPALRLHAQRAGRGPHHRHRPGRHRLHRAGDRALSARPLARPFAGAYMMTDQTEIARNGQWVTGKGGLLFVRHWPAQATPLASLVICHGFNAHSGHYARAAEVFAARSIAVTAPDLRGRGRSEGERFYVRSMDEYVSDLALALRAARERTPGPPLFLLGHSAGGVTSLLYALEKQDDLAGLICESIAYRLPAPGVALAILKGLSHIAPHAHVLRLKPEDFSRDPAWVDRLRADLLVADEVQPVRTVAALTRADEHLGRNFGKLPLPMLIIHGTADDAALPNGSQELFDAAASLDKTLKLYDGHKHDLLNDLGRDRVTNDIGTWIEQRARMVS